MSNNPAVNPQDFKVSIVTPVYNAAAFVTRAVESALAQPETGEVLLIEDGSHDNSLLVCQELAEKYNKVKLLRHPNGENRGASASRNLGMRTASYEYIAFLDADDYYLPERFTTTRVIFERDPNAEGVYEAAGSYIENTEGRVRWENAGRSTNHFYTMRPNIPPEELSSALLNSGSYGYFHLDSYTIKFNVLSKSGFMNEFLKLHQDTDFIFRTSCVARLLPGRLDAPVSMVRIHDHNRITSPQSQTQDYKNKMAYWLSIYRWSKVNTDPNLQKQILESIILFTQGHKYFKKFPRSIFPTKLIHLSRLFRLIGYPEVIRSIFTRAIHS